jgi:hypothetical protein
MKRINQVGLMIWRRNLKEIKDGTYKPDPRTNRPYFGETVDKEEYCKRRIEELLEEGEG